jgi:hypothetical protein
MAGRITDGWLMNTAWHAQPAAGADSMTRLELGSTLPVSGLVNLRDDEVVITSTHRLRSTRGLDKIIPWIWRRAGSSREAFRCVSF